MEEAGEEVVLLSFNKRTTKLVRIGTASGQIFAISRPELANQFMQFVMGVYQDNIFDFLLRQHALWLISPDTSGNL